MRLLISPLKPKQFSLVIVAAMLTMALVGMTASYWFKPLQGDLTRIGYLPESDFMPIQAQVHNVPDTSPPTPIDRADMLIIGDSFSITNDWQRHLHAKGITTTMLHWDDLQYCGPNDTSYADYLVRRIRTTGFRGRYLVLQSVERAFENRMQNHCHKQATINPAASVALHIPLQPPTLGWGWVYQTLWHTLQLRFAPTRDRQFGDTRVIAMNGCKLFSHQQCGYSLFYKEDFEKPSFSSTLQVTAIDQQLRQLNLQPLWLVVPDKSTVYLGYGTQNERPYVNIWQALATHSHVIAPDLGALFQHQSRQQRDFYLPNDTHLGQAGYQSLAEQVLKALPAVPSPGLPTTAEPSP
ncbi:hypothetical protein [Chitinivorax sp. B]|uniref:alginate O-acetyltransferase AlgX-related protein n=1 Tax=Chitinivorax sp. B TaxID=2502235 RepID=UPI0014858CBD|nr:hypothetical protein [Chitinivorax sp. B]